MADLKLVPASKLPKRHVDVLGEKCVVTPVTKDVRVTVAALEKELEALLEKDDPAEEAVVACMSKQLDVLLDPPVGDKVAETHAANDLTFDQVAEFLGSVKTPEDATGN